MSRGFLRLWIFISCLWVSFCIGITVHHYRNYDKATFLVDMVYEGYLPHSVGNSTGAVVYRDRYSSKVRVLEVSSLALVPPIFLFLFFLSAAWVGRGFSKK